jgi:hypothetical protein
MQGFAVKYQKEVHRAGIEPAALHWESRMLPLHQRHCLLKSRVCCLMTAVAEFPVPARNPCAWNIGAVLHLFSSILFANEGMKDYELCLLQKIPWMGNDQEDAEQAKEKQFMEQAMSRSIIQKKIKKKCTVRESNPLPYLGKVGCYHYTNGTGC